MRYRVWFFVLVTVLMLPGAVAAQATPEPVTSALLADALPTAADLGGAFTEDRDVILTSTAFPASAGRSYVGDGGARALVIVLAGVAGQTFLHDRLEGYRWDAAYSLTASTDPTDLPDSVNHAERLTGQNTDYGLPASFGLYEADPDLLIFVIVEGVTDLPASGQTEADRVAVWILNAIGLA